MKYKPLKKWIGMTICAATVFVAADRACFGECLTDLPELTRPRTSRISPERLIPPEMYTADVTDTRHAAMLDATRGTKEELIGGRQSTLEPVSFAKPEGAAKRLQPPERPELVLEPPEEFSKPELTLEALTEDSKAPQSD